MAVKMFEVLHGPVDLPLDEWDRQYTFAYDDEKAKGLNLYHDNIPPEMVQEHYVRRNNWDLEYKAKNWPETYPMTHRWMMRQVPAEQDYKKRAADNGWVIVDDLVHRDYSLPRLSDDKTQITYYETEKDARLDRPKTIKAVRYMRQLGYDEDGVERLCNRYDIPYGSEFVLKFAKTREEIRHVYVHGPRSCMSGENDSEYYGVHPVEAYACDPLAIAYLVSKEDEEHISARVLVNTKTKEYIQKMYGASTQLTSLLRNEGYTRNNSCVRGEKLLVVKAVLENAYKGTEILPYMDFHYNEFVKSPCGNFWEIT